MAYAPYLGLIDPTLNTMRHAKKGMPWAKYQNVQVWKWIFIFTAWLGKNLGGAPSVLAVQDHTMSAVNVESLDHGRKVFCGTLRTNRLNCRAMWTIVKATFRNVKYR